MGRNTTINGKNLLIYHFPNVIGEFSVVKNESILLCYDLRSAFRNVWKDACEGIFTNNPKPTLQVNKECLFNLVD